MKMCHLWLLHCLSAGTYGLKKKGFAEVLNNASVKKLIKSE